MKHYSEGGKSTPATKGQPKPRKRPPEAGAGDVTPPPGAPGMPGGPPLPKGYAKGGYTRAADGIAKKGKTRGRVL